MHKEARLRGDGVELELPGETAGLEVVLAYRQDGELHELAEMEPPLVARLERLPAP